MSYGNKHLKLRVIRIKENEFLAQQPNGDVLAITLVEVIDGHEKRVADVNAKLIEFLNSVEIPLVK